MKNIILIFLVSIVLLSCENGPNDTTNLSGKGGSTARFALSEDHLYVVSDRNIQVYGIAANGAAVAGEEVSVGFGIETIFARGNNLFLGANDAMYTYDITDRDHPVFVSRYSHILSCDPVVVSGQYAYVTLRVRENCRESADDALEIIDITNLNTPTLVKTYPMNSPYGLGVDGTTLFVCEGDAGLKIFDASDPLNIELKKQYGMNAFDVIPNDGVLVLTGSGGIYQYDYTDVEAISLLSHIPVAQ